MTRQSRHVISTLIILVFFPILTVFAAETSSPAALSFAERVSFSERIEDVYWSHRIWPQANPTAKPRRDAIITHEQIVAKVERSLLLEAVLEQMWGEHLTPERIQLELNRIVKTTRHPELLSDVIAALDHDAFLIAECFVRPRLIERLVNERYAWDQEIHSELRARAEAEFAGVRSIADLEASTAESFESEWILTDGVEPNAPLSKAQLELSLDEWTAKTTELAERFRLNSPPDPGAPVLSALDDELVRQVGQGISPLFETVGAFAVVEVLEAENGLVRVATASWPKVAFSDWLASATPNLKPAAPKGGSYALPKLATGDPCLDDTWMPTAGSGPPTSRSSHTAVWTGTEMIVWGGHDGSPSNTGSRYEAASDSWMPISTGEAPAGRYVHTAVWTGSKMIVWGGADLSSALNTGGRYDPATDSWAAVTTTSAPTARNNHMAVWAGTEMIVWGGRNGSTYHNSGGRYDPSTDTWTPTTMTGAPVGRAYGDAVWTGTEMIVWGGLNTTPQSTGGRYDPISDSWTPTTTTGAPSIRYNIVAEWTGLEMIVWGGHNGGSPLNSGGRYDPIADSWSSTSQVGAPVGRNGHVGVWTGTEMIVWGGTDQVSGFDSGGVYDPVGDSWTPTTTTGAPVGRWGTIAVWTGTEMIVWGGYDGSNLNTGGRYDPALDSWIATAAVGALTERQSHTAVWTGAEMIVWGGYSSVQAGYLNGGGRYDPASDSWSATTTTGAPTSRSAHAAVWSGTEMIIWGGYGGSNLNTGGRYDPVIDEWTATATSGAPAGRYDVAGVWTGTEMIVWGGWNSSVSLNSGGRYNPDTDTWEATSASGSPSARYAHTTVWTGMEMIVWGGLAGTITNTGGRYDPVSDSWTATTTSGAPSSRWAATAAWTGIEMAVWGGNNGTSEVDTGGRYNPVTDGWVAITTDDAPAARRNHKGIWTGSEMILWGGRLSSGDLPVEGGRYDPAMDSWKATSNTAVPSGRQNHQVTWTGSEMITWGGNDGNVSLDSGGRYCASGVLGIDYGDAPDPTYPTLSASNGARHPFDGVLYLGSTVDGELDGHPTASADGDDLDGLDDEDGVTFTSALRLGLNATLDVTASSAGLLNAWVDFNADGDWNDAAEQVFTDTALATGTNNLQLTVPLDAVLGTTFARFRFDSAGGLTPTGLAADGEVEDYTLFIEPSAEVAVSISDGPDPVVQGGRLVYYSSVTNNGGLEATGVVLTATLDGNASFVSASLPACSETGGVVTCTLGAMTTGTSTMVSIEVDVSAGFTGTLSNTAVVTLNENDPVPANNTDTENTTVAAAADYLFADGFETGDIDRWSSTAP